MRHSIHKLLLGLAFLGCIAAPLAQADGHMKKADMTLHHMHVMINHAMEMAAQGSNLIMLGKMNMAKGVDEISIAHGEQMIGHAKHLVEEMMSGEAMGKLHASGAGELPAMAYTHQLGEAAMNYIELLEGMSSGKSAKGYEHKH
ncbi:hypothetical protein [Amphritea sp. HPY]|uniref:hypothetical protein n=1 Tax=Amphritea sp. HPY TaxID=3421652 RepID=UPI003D7D219B